MIDKRQNERLRSLVGKLQCHIFLKNVISKEENSDDEISDDENSDNR